MAGIEENGRTCYIPQSDVRMGSEIATRYARGAVEEGADLDPPEQRLRPGSEPGGSRSER